MKSENWRNWLLGATIGLTLTAIGVPGTFAQTASLLPNAVQYFMDGNGKPLANGKVFFYEPGGTTPKTTWTTANESVPQANPVVLGSSGRPVNPIYGDGSYRQIVKDQFNNVIWDFNTASAGGGSTAPAFSEGVMVGTIIPWANMTLPGKYLYTAGQAISRTTYPELFTAITFSANILCSIGIASITVSTEISDKTPIGAPVEFSCFAPGTTVLSKISGQLTLSSNATVTASVSGKIFPWGNGNGSTTFNVPEVRGRVPVGRDNMNGSIAGVLTSALYGSNPDAMAARGGNQSTTMVLSNLPPYTPAGSITNGAITTTTSFHGGTSTNTSAPDSGSTYLIDAGVISISSSQAASSFAGTPMGGTSVPFRTIQPSVAVDYIIKALPDDTPSGPGVTSINGMTGAITCGLGITCTANTISTASSGTANLWPLFSTGGSTPPAYRAIVGSDLPNPSVASLGAVFSSAAVSNQFITSINTDGTVSRALPVNNFSTTITAATGGTITMTSASTGVQILTGALGETYQLPDATTLVLGQPFLFNDNSAGNLTIKDGGGSTLFTVLNGGMVQAFVTNIGSVAGTWDFHAFVPPTASWGSSGLTLNNEYLKMLGSINSTAWTTNGVRITQDASTLTDTTSSGVVATAYTNVFGGSAIAATNPTTFTNYYGAYFKEPTAGTNVTLTDKKALGADSLRVTGGSVLDGGLTVQTGFLATGLVGNASLANMTNSTVKCRTTAGTGVPEDCTAAQVRTITEQGTTLLAVLVASSSANLSDTTHFTSSFDDYMITFNNVVPATNSVGFNCLYHSGGVFPATNYVNNAGASTTFADMTSGGATVANTAGGGVTGTVYLRNVNSTSVNKFIDGRVYALLSGGGLSANNTVAIWNGAQTAIDGIQCQFTSGNISTGNIKIYGLRAAL